MKYFVPIFLLVAMNINLSFAQLGPSVPDNSDNLLQEQIEKTQEQFRQIRKAQVFFETSPTKIELDTEIEIEIKSYNFNVNNSYITWKENNKTIQEGRGKKTIKTKITSIEEIKKYEVEIIEPQNAEPINKTFILKIFDIDILWQKSGATIPFFRGRIKPIGGNAVDVMAITNSYNNNGFSYEWEIDFKKQKDYSGFNKNFFTFETQKNSNENYLIKVRSVEINGGVGEAEIIIPSDNPKIFVYENSLLGVNFSKLLEKDIDAKAQNNISLIAFALGPNQKEAIDWQFNTQIIKNQNAINIKKNRTGQNEIMIGIADNNFRKKYNLEF